MAFHESAFAQLMASRLGRGLRIVVGLALIGWGWSMWGVTAGYVLIVAGLIPLAAGLLDICLIAPLFGSPLSGEKIRAAAKAPSANTL